MHSSLPALHRRHRPETTAFYAIVRDHLAGFERLAEEHYTAPLPRYVLRSFRAYLRCGLLEHGFLRVRCDRCRKDRLVAFSCKQRGPCPSCAARVMCNTAAHLTDRVLPNVPIRQWVLSLPFELRIAAARDPRLVAACDRILVEAVFHWMREQLATRSARGGAATFVQRFGGALNLHVHFHTLVLDGVFVRSKVLDSTPVFLPAPSPTVIDLTRVLERICADVRKWIAAREPPADREPDALRDCTRVAVQRGLFTDLGSTATPSGDDEMPPGTRRKSASLDGFDLHAAVRIGADDDVARERLVRYCARPAFALERLSVLADGRIAYAIKAPRRGATHRLLTPIELLARIAAIIPPPRHPFLRYHGVLAPASKWRPEIVPRMALSNSTAVAKSNGDEGATHDCANTSSDDRLPQRPSIPKLIPARPSSNERKRNRTESKGNIDPPWQRPQSDRTGAPSRTITEAHHRRLFDGRLLATSPRLDWAKLLRRTYATDVLLCPRCEGRTRIVAAITDPPVIRRILAHLRIPPARAPPCGAREPLFDDDTWLDATSALDD